MRERETERERMEGRVRERGWKGEDWWCEGETETERERMEGRERERVEGRGLVV